MKVLHISLIKQWFDMTDSGEKTEEYREITPYWIIRLLHNPRNIRIPDRRGFNNVSSDFYYSLGFKGSRLEALRYMLDCGYEFKTFDRVRAVNGYGNHRPRWERMCDGISTSEGKEEWGAQPGKEYFVIKLGETYKP